MPKSVIIAPNNDRMQKRVLFSETRLKSRGLKILDILGFFQRVLPCKFSNFQNLNPKWANICGFVST